MKLYISSYISIINIIYSVYVFFDIDIKNGSDSCLPGCPA